MIAGTLVACGALGQPFGCSLQRGTVLLLSRDAAEVDEQLPGFTAGEPVELSVLPMLLASLRAYLPDHPLVAQPTTLAMRAIGDRADGGYGELLWFPRESSIAADLGPS